MKAERLSRHDRCFPSHKLVGQTSCLPVRAASCRQKHEARMPREPAGWEARPTWLRFMAPIRVQFLEVFTFHEPNVGAQRVAVLAERCSALGLVNGSMRRRQ